MTARTNTHSMFFGCATGYLTLVEAADRALVAQPTYTVKLVRMNCRHMPQACVRATHTCVLNAFTMRGEHTLRHVWRNNI